MGRVLPLYQGLCVILKGCCGTVHVAKAQMPVEEDEPEEDMSPPDNAIGDI